MSQGISVVIPALNEAAEIAATIEHARAVMEVAEVIVADGGSTDGTIEIARQLNCRVVEAPRGRGRQMRAGAAAATGDVVMLLHADTWLAPDAGRAIFSTLAKPRVVGGGCYKVFRDPHWLMRGSRLKCAIRFHVFHRFMGDQAMFVAREILERIGGVPDVPIMEEFELCRGLRREGRLALAETVVSTSARRFREHGVLRTYARMGRVTLQYFLGAPLDQLRRTYEGR